MFSWRRLAILATVVACLALSASAQQRTEVKVGSKAKSIRDGAPRFIGSACPYAPSGAAEDRRAECDSQAYAVNLGIIAGFCVVMALLSWLFILCRCCCGLCCACCKTTGSESATENRKMWLIASIVLASIMFILAAVAIGFSQSFTDSFVSGKTSSFGVFIELVRDLGRFSLKTRDLSQGIIDALNDAVDTIRGSLSAGRGVTRSSQDAVECMDQVAAELSGFTGCGGCASVATVIGKGASAMKKGTDGFFAEFDGALSSVQRDLVDVQDDTNRQLSSFIRTMGDVDTVFSGAEDSLEDAKGQVEDFDHKRHLALVFLVLPFLLSFGFVLVGLYTKNSAVFRCNFWVVLGFTGFLWIIAAVHAPFTILLADGCGILDKGEVALTDQFAVQPKSAAIVYTCIDDVPLKDAIPELESLNMRDRLEASWPTRDARSINDSFVGADEARARINALDCSAAGAACTNTKAKWDTCMLKMDYVKRNMTVIANSVGDIRRDVNPALDLVDEFLKEATCGMLGKAYRGLKTGLCNDLPGDLGGIALVMVMLGSFGFMSIYVSLKTRAAHMGFEHKSALWQPLDSQDDHLALNSTGPGDFRPVTAY